MPWWPRRQMSRGHVTGRGSADAGCDRRSWRVLRSPPVLYQSMMPSTMPSPEHRQAACEAQLKVTLCAGGVSGGLALVVLPRPQAGDKQDNASASRKDACRQCATETMHIVSWLCPDLTVAHAPRTDLAQLIVGRTEGASQALPGVGAGTTGTGSAATIALRARLSAERL